MRLFDRVRSAHRRPTLPPAPDPTPPSPAATPAVAGPIPGPRLPTPGGSLGDRPLPMPTEARTPPPPSRA